MKFTDPIMLFVSAAMAAALASIFLFDLSAFDAATVRFDSIIAASALGMLLVLV